MCLNFKLPIWSQAIKGAIAAESGRMLLPSIVRLSVAAISSGFIVSATDYCIPLMLLRPIMTWALGF